ncbi:MAG: tetratricopeptide repeat protein [Bryobacteraceae bacterium]
MTIGWSKICGLLFCAALAGSLAAQTAPDFDGIVKSADQARDAGQTEQAVALYQKALHLKPDWRQGWWVLGSILYDANRYQQCEEAFLPLTALDPQKSAGWAMAGLCEFEIKHYEDALAHLQKAEQVGLPQSLYGVAQYHIDLILIRTGQFDLANEMISRAALRHEENPRLVAAMGLAGLRRAQLPQDVSPADQDLVMALGRAMCDAAASNTKLAIEEFEVLLAKYPNTPELHYLFGLVLLESDPDKALSAFQRELALSPKHPQTLISIAAEYVRRGEYQKALPYAQKAVISAPKYFAAHAMLGKVLVEGGLDLPRGIKELQAAVGMAPGNPQSRLALAAAYTKAGRKQDAAAQRAEFLRLRTQLDASASGQK